jgi:(5-formylfuran-3-yl)methyl phosphate synthase
MPARASTQLLVSVRSAAEAQAALDGGADIIDVKEPSRGSLGMADAAVIQEIVATVDGRAPVSVALGDLQDNHHLSRLPGVTWAKLGYRPTGPRWEATDWDFLLAEGHVRPAKLIPVFYADARRIRTVRFDMKFKMFRYQRNVNSRPEGVVLDTALKDGQGLLSWFTLAELQEIQRLCEESSLFLALAGSLSLDDVKLLMQEVRPNIIAVRGAACEVRDRNGQVNVAAVAALKAIIRGDSPA